VVGVDQTKGVERATLHVAGAVALAGQIRLEYLPSLFIAISIRGRSSIKVQAINKNNRYNTQIYCAYDPWRNLYDRHKIKSTDANSVPSNATLHEIRPKNNVVRVLIFMYPVSL
jgi:hypothetical protein